MKKKLNEEAVLSELRQGSAFFREAQQPTPKVKKLEEKKKDNSTRLH